MLVFCHDVFRTGIFTRNFVFYDEGLKVMVMIFFNIKYDTVNKVFFIKKIAYTYQSAVI